MTTEEQTVHGYMKAAIIALIIFTVVYMGVALALWSTGHRGPVCQPGRITYTNETNCPCKTDCGGE